MPDRGLKAWYSFQRDIEGYCKDLKRCDTVEEAEKIGGDIDWAIGSLLWNLLIKCSKFILMQNSNSKDAKQGQATIAANPLLNAVSSIGEMSNKERYIKTINLAVKQMKSELSLMEEIELSICTELNIVVRNGI